MCTKKFLGHSSKYKHSDRGTVPENATKFVQVYLQKESSIIKQGNANSVSKPSFPLKVSTFHKPGLQLNKGEANVEMMNYCG